VREGDYENRDNFIVRTEERGRERGEGGAEESSGGKRGLQCQRGSTGLSLSHSRCLFYRIEREINLLS
jgi:hypothetical protein